jgi:hypothetical protein
MLINDGKGKDLEGDGHGLFEGTSQLSSTV